MTARTTSHGSALAEMLSIGNRDEQYNSGRLRCSGDRRVPVANSISELLREKREALPAQQSLFEHATQKGRGNNF
jgi:hypothetical protein